MKKKSFIKFALVNTLTLPIRIVVLILATVFVIVLRSWFLSKKFHTWLEFHEKGVIVKR
jgi:hypothetical protein